MSRASANCVALSTASAPTPSKAGRRTWSIPKRRSVSTSTPVAALSVRFSLTGIARISLRPGLGAVAMLSFSHRREGLIIGSDKVQVRRSLDAAALPGTRLPEQLPPSA